MINPRRLVLMMAVFIIFLPVRSLAGTVDLPQTGQTTCYDEDGNVIDCTGTGQDGDIQAGVPWPEPRFTGNGDGTITDNLTGLMWLKDAHCLAGITWQGALDTVADFNVNADSYDCLFYTANYSDWRLPNVNELESLVNAEAADLRGWLMSEGFLNVQYGNYWSSTTRAGFTNDRLYVDMRYGGVSVIYNTTLSESVNLR